MVLCELKDAFQTLGWKPREYDPNERLVVGLAWGNGWDDRTELIELYAEGSFTLSATAQVIPAETPRRMPFLVTHKTAPGLLLALAFRESRG